MKRGTGVPSITWPESVDEAQAGRASYEQKTAATLSPQDIREFMRNAAAWKYYGTVTPGYLQLVNWWITSAKKPETRAKRLKKLIEACRDGRRLGWGD